MKQAMRFVLQVITFATVLSLYTLFSTLVFGFIAMVCVETGYNRWSQILAILWVLHAVVLALPIVTVTYFSKRRKALTIINSMEVAT